MMHRVIVPFPYYPDGTTLVDLNAGDERDFGDLAIGLEREGYIVPADAPAPAAKEDAPDEADKPRRGKQPKGSR